MGFPTGINPALPVGSNSPGDGDNNLRDLKQFLVDILGLTAGSNNITEACTIFPTSDGNWPTYVRLTNATGGSLAANDVVQVDTGADSSVVLGNTLANRAQLVVAAETIANGSEGLFRRTGICNVATTGTVARGQYLWKSASTKVAADTGVAMASGTGIPPGAFAVALAAASGNICRVLLLGHTYGGAGFGARVHNAGALSVAHNSATELTFDTERYDVGGFHSVSVESGHLIAPVAGKYLITGHIQFASNNDYTIIQLFIRTGGTTYIAAEDISVIFGTGVEARSIASIYSLAATEYVELIAYQFNGTADAQDVSVTANWSPEFAIHYLGA